MNIRYCLMVVLLLAEAAFAHTPLLVIENNDDGTLLVQGGFSTGQGTEGIDLFIKNKLEGKILQHLKFPDTSEVQLTIPEEPYYLVMDAGPGHKVVKEGPVPPGGFTRNVEAVSLEIEKEDLSGLPVSIPVVIVIVIVGGLAIFLLPKLTAKKR